MSFRDAEKLVVYPSGMFTFGIGVGTGADTSGLTVTRVNDETINVSVHNWRTSMGAEITPDQARKLAAALLAVADVLDAEPN